MPNTQSKTQSLAAPSPVGARWESLVGGRFGRYEVTGQLGAGGMGVVYEARDPDLHRNVAIKLSFDRRPRDLQRFIREAQAMAAVDHPNVVTVFDYGVQHCRPYVVMEVLEGGTLRDACRDQPLERILGLLKACAQGLHAAHEVGIVHRDFKPANVLMGRERTPVVTDFGLAVPSDTTQELDDLEQRTMAAGTPAYMSPEQHGGLPADGRSDQYSFCVTAVELLTGHRPFSGSSNAALLSAKRRGPAHAQLRGLPVHVQRALTRGLAPRPSERFDTMPGLLRALDPSPPRRGWFALGGSSVALGVGTATALLMGPTDRCPPPTLPAWDEGSRMNVETALMRNSSTEESGTRVQALLDTYAANWSEASVRACQAESPRPVFACLEQRADAFERLVHRMVRGGVDAASATSMSVELEPTHPCLVALERSPSDESDTWLTESKRLRRMALAARNEGHVADSIHLLRDARHATSRVRDDASRARELAQIGDALDSSGAPREARDTLLLALDTAPRNASIESQASLTLGWVDGVSLADPVAGRRWLRRATAAMERGEAGLDQRLLAESHAATLEASLGDYDAARRRLTRAIELATASPPEASERPAWLRRRAQLQHNHCTVNLWTGDHEQALSSCESAVALFEAALGSGHPEVSDSLIGVFDAAFALGRIDGAEQAASRSLRILTRWRGADHPSTGPIHKELALTEYARGDLQKSRRHLERAIEVTPSDDLLRAHHEADHIDLLRELGEVEVGRTRALELLDRLEGVPDTHARIPRASTLRVLSMLELSRGDARASLEAYERALEAASGTQFYADNRDLFAATELRVRRANGQLDAAVDLARRELATRRSFADDSQASGLLLEVVDTLVAAGQHAEARSWVERLQSKDASSASRWVELAERIPTTQ